MGANAYLVETSERRKFVVVAKNEAVASSSAFLQLSEWGYRKAREAVVSVSLIASGDQYGPEQIPWLLVSPSALDN